MATDYDDFASEAEGTDGPTVRLAGESWTLPHRSQVSAKAVADFQRLRAVMGKAMKSGDLSDDDEVPDDLLDGMEQLTPAGLLRTLIGDQADRMLDAGAGHGAIERLARDYSQYVEQGGGPLAPDPPANRAERRARGSTGKTSKSGGASSKPTSSGSTGST